MQDNKIIITPNLLYKDWLEVPRNDYIGFDLDGNLCLLRNFLNLEEVIPILKIIKNILEKLGYTLDGVFANSKMSFYALRLGLEYQKIIVIDNEINFVHQFIDNYNLDNIRDCKKIIREYFIELANQDFEEFIDNKTGYCHRLTMMFEKIREETGIILTSERYQLLENPQKIVEGKKQDLTLEELQLVSGLLEPLFIT